MDRVILHCDLNNFYASVECLRHPELKCKPVAVSGNPKTRTGIILAKNTLAKSYGVSTGDTIWKARQKCPDLICVSPHHEEYTKYSKMVRDIYLRFTDRVEPFGPDECWLDVTHSTKLFGSGKQIADTLRETVKNEIGLTISVGVSFCKMFAKLGSDLKKPDATTEITKENFRQIVWPLPASSLMYIGRHREQTLKKLNINTCRDLAYADEKILTHYFGINGKEIVDIARGLDKSEVALYGDNAEVKSIGNGTTAIHDITSRDEFNKITYYLCDSVMTRMRKKMFAAETLTLSIKDSDLSWVSYSKSYTTPISNTKDMYEKACALYEKNWKTLKPIRAVRVACSNLISDSSSIQFDMFTSEKTTKRKQNEEKSIDKVREKYGSNGIKKALLMNTDNLIRTTSDDEFY